MPTLRERLSDVFAQIGADVKAISARIIPAGGTTGQVLRKASNSDYAVAWANPLADEVCFSVDQAGFYYAGFNKACTLSNYTVRHGGTAPTVSWATSTDGTTWTTVTPNTASLSIAAGTVLRAQVTAFTVFATITMDRS